MSKDTKRRQKLERQLYSRLPLIGGWLRRRAADALARDGSPQAIEALAEAVTRNPRVRPIALQALRDVEAQPGVDAVCAVWAETRHPDLAALLDERGWVAARPPAVRVLSALYVGDLAAVASAGVSVAGPLVQACQDADPLILGRAQQAVDALANSRTRRAFADRLCAAWAKTRSPRLEAVMLRGRHVAREPLEVRVLSALRTVQPGLLGDLDAGGVPPLVQACQDEDDTIAGGAHMVLRQLADKGAREAVCRLVLEQDHPVARAAAVDAGYAPRDAYQRALFFFLTEQWGRYEALDFDQQMLRTTYEAADEALRRRIRERLRAAGRTDFLTVVAGGDYRARAPLMTAGEAEFLVKTLSAQEEWGRLWDLAFELHFDWSVRILKILSQNGWQPPAQDERAAFQDLADLVAGKMLDTLGLLESLPPAAQRARARVPGHINAVAFSPRRPVIAVGTGRRKVVLWNLKQARREMVLGGFEHSVGHVTFAADEALWCAERTNTTDPPCALYRWSGDDLVRVGQHRGSVTDIVPVGEDRVLSTGRDRRVILWDRAQQLQHRIFYFWPRAARVSPDKSRVALLHRYVTLISLPYLDVVSGGNAGQGVSRCATFGPAGEELVVGKFNGAVRVCRRVGKRLRVARQSPFQHKGQVEGLEMLVDRAILITAGADSRVHFLAWPDLVPVDSLSVPGGRLTSLHVSPDGAFMALGDSDASLTLWDLRPLGVPALFGRPLGLAQPAHLPAVAALAGDITLSDPARGAMQFVERLLRHRFRHDIEIDDLPEIQAGEFDIEIEIQEE